MDSLACKYLYFYHYEINSLVCFPLNPHKLIIWLAACLKSPKICLFEHFYWCSLEKLVLCTSDLLFNGLASTPCVHCCCISYTTACTMTQTETDTHQTSRRLWARPCRYPTSTMMLWLNGSKHRLQINVQVSTYAAALVGLMMAYFSLLWSLSLSCWSLERVVPSLQSPIDTLRSLFTS